MTMRLIIESKTDRTNIVPIADSFWDSFDSIHSMSDYFWTNFRTPSRSLENNLSRLLHWN